MRDLQSFNKITILFLILLLQVNNVDAHNTDPICNNIEDKISCDLCSCSTSSGSLGFGTLSNSNFVGLRYIYQNFESKDGIFSNSPTTKESFNTYQLWAQIPLSESFYVSANLPYQNLKRTYENKDSEKISGVGDASFIGWYRFIFYKKQNENRVTIEKEASGHSIKFGLGIKLPTGKFEQRLVDNVNPGFQVGTGSVDGIFSLGYSYGKNKQGVNTLFNYYAKGENKNEYQFGNQFSYSVNYYRAFSSKKINIMPFVGFSGETYDKIKQYDETILDTDGSILNATIGSELAIDKFIIGVSYSVPLTQSLFGDNVVAKQQLSVYVNYAL